MCGKFTYIDNNIGEIQNKLAINSRLNEDECGKEGNFYEPIKGKFKEYQPTI
jgi:hypothetical protein